jgi:uncharacterized protein YbdZ (MbtH family)
MTNPFEDENGIYHVLVNDHKEHSLWPSYIAVPAGWIVVHQSQSRADCLAFIKQHWTHTHPKQPFDDAPPSK